MKYYTSVSVLINGMEVSVSSHFANKTAILKKLQKMERAYTKESLLPNSSEWHLAEHPTDVPDLLPTQEKSETSDGKGNALLSDKQADGAESSELLTITPAVYVGKSRGGKPGRKTPIHRVTFNRRLTVEEARAVKTFANEEFGEKKDRIATKRGWADREVADGSWQFRRKIDAMTDKMIEAEVENRIQEELKGKPFMDAGQICEACA